jgi:universal stress protein A
MLLDRQSGVENAAIRGISTTRSFQSKPASTAHRLRFPSAGFRFRKHLFIVAEVAVMLALRRILHPTDFSSYSEASRRFAVSLARDHRAELILVHVEEPTTPVGAEGPIYVPTLGDLDALRERLNQLHIDNLTIAVERVVVEGDAATEILELARNRKCDLIVMGTHGRTGLQRLVMGSVAEQVVRKAHCPVLTVKFPPAATGTKETSDLADVAEIAV